MQLSEIRVFHIGTDYVAAADEESAKKYYVDMVGEEDAACQELEVDEVPRNQWPTMKIVDIDEPGHPTRTFQESIEEMLTWKDQEYPKTLATTEY